MATVGVPSWEEIDKQSSFILHFTMPEYSLDCRRDIGWIKECQTDPELKHWQDRINTCQELVNWYKQQHSVEDPENYPRYVIWLKEQLTHYQLRLIEYKRMIAIFHLNQELQHPTILLMNKRKLITEEKSDNKKSETLLEFYLDKFGKDVCKLIGKFIGYARIYFNDDRRSTGFEIGFCFPLRPKSYLGYLPQQSYFLSHYYQCRGGQGFGCYCGVWRYFIQDIYLWHDTKSVKEFFYSDGVNDTIKNQLSNFNIIIDQQGNWVDDTRTHEDKMQIVLQNWNEPNANPINMRRFDRA